MGVATPLIRLGTRAIRTRGLILGALLTACAPLVETPAPWQPQTEEPHAAQPGTQLEQIRTPPEATGAAASKLIASAWTDLPGWAADDHAAALAAFVRSCEVLGKREAWRQVCARATSSAKNPGAAARAFFEAHFRPHRMLTAEGEGEGLITGYYEPLLNGSRKQTARYRYPLYGVPDDLLIVDLAELHPELKGQRLRGRLEGRRVVPYYSRAEIEARDGSSRADVLAWVDDPVELFFLQVQGSGQLRLDDSQRLRVGFAEHNGHPYRSIGRLLVERGELTLEQASMQGIKAWARKNPHKLAPVLHHNARYVFFRELDARLPGPIGALGIPLTAERSLAIDPAHVPLGAPVYLSTSWPNSKRVLERLMIAQDTGGAIRGALRGDFYWGFGDVAGARAGAMRQSGRMWILVPQAVAPEALLPK